MSAPVSNRRQARNRSQSLRRQLLHQRYLLKDASGQVVETPRQMFLRVAKAIAAPEANYGATLAEVQDVARRFFRLMHRRLFLPNSPTLMNAGREDGMCVACFVLPVTDCIEGIFDSITQTAFIQRSGGGTGFAFDELRPTGDVVSSSGGRTSGPISFMRVFAETTQAIQQGAHRRGANMGMMSVEHPDILKFITAKDRTGAFDNFNLSVKLGNIWMEMLRTHPNRPHVVINPRTDERHVIPRSVDVQSYTIQDLPSADGADVPCYTVGEMWEKIIACAWGTGEPGICFIDRVNEDNPTPQLGRIKATNPCGEQPLLPYECCNLGSINLSRFIASDGKNVRWLELGETVKLALRFLDNVVDSTHYPTEKIRSRSIGNRKIGLGIMGFADALVRLGIRYDSREAVDFASRTSRFIQQQSHDASQELALERGAFPNWAGSVWDTRYNCPMRNASCTTIAPTGSISVIAGCSSGIEPIYRLAYRRRALDGQEFVQVHPLLEQIGRRDGWMNDSVRKALLEGAAASEIPDIPRRLAEALVTAHEIAPSWHVRMQAVFQDNIDSAVSKTVNMPTEATVADVDKVFRLAFKLRCKGITVYRDGSRTGQTLSGTRKGQETNATTDTSPRFRRRVTAGKTTKFRMGCGTLFVTVNRDEEGLCEVFANLGKAGGCPSQTEATCRAVSVALRSGVAPKELIQQLRGIRCLSAATARKNGERVNVRSCPDAIARAMEEALDGPAGLGEDPSPAHRVCPACAQSLHRESGCWVCTCGYSKCG